MKRLIPIIIVLFTHVAHATPVDSMLGPFRLPFTISVTANGLFRDSSNHQQSATYSPNSFGATLVVDTSSGRRGILRGDTIVIGGFTDNCIIIFDSSTHTIKNFVLGHYTNDQTPGFHSLETSWSIAMSNMRYDSVIYVTDSTTTSHAVTASYDQSGWSGTNTEVWSTLLDLYSLDLSGIFHPAHLVNPTADVRVITPALNFTVHESNGRIDCAFRSSAHERMLEVYSSIGIMMAKYSVSAGQESITTPILPTGVYFLRLEDQISKILISN